MQLPAAVRLRRRVPPHVRELPLISSRYIDGQPQGPCMVWSFNSRQACALPKSRLRNRASTKCLNKHRINCHPQYERGWMNSAPFHATRPMLLTYYPGTYYLRRPPHSFALLESTYPMKTPIPFNKDRLHLRSKPSVTFLLHNAGKVMRQTPHRNQMHMVLAVPQATLSTANNVIFRCSPFKRTPA